MRFPWVSRSLFERQERWFLREREDHIEAQRLFCARADMAERRLEREMVSSQAMYAELLTRYHQLKLNGFVEHKEPVLPLTEPVDPVMQAVNEACAGKGIAVRKAMLLQVRHDRAAELNDEAIIMRIRRGNRVEDEFSQ